MLFVCSAGSAVFFLELYAKISCLHLEMMMRAVRLNQNSKVAEHKTKSTTLNVQYS